MRQPLAHLKGLPVAENTLPQRWADFLLAAAAKLEGQEAQCRAVGMSEDRSATARINAYRARAEQLRGGMAFEQCITTPPEICESILQRGLPYPPDQTGDDFENA